MLGPLLFVIYIQDLIEALNQTCQNIEIYAFADDIKLLSTSHADLQEALSIVDDWMDRWGLKLNTDKSEHLTIRESQHHTFQIKGKPVPKISLVRDLGVTISNNLSSRPYIDKIRSKANILSNIILRTFSPNNYDLIVNLFKTYVRPIAEYNTCSWSPYQLLDIKEIEKVQQTFTKKLCQRSNISFSSYQERLKILKLESLQSRRVKRDLVYMYKIIHKLVDVNFADFFEFSNFNGHCLRRHNLHLLRKKPAKTQVRNNFFSVRVIKMWNDLPADTVNSQSLAIFKRELDCIELNL